MGKEQSARRDPVGEAFRRARDDWHSRPPIDKPVRQPPGWIERLVRTAWQLAKRKAAL